MGVSLVSRLASLMTFPTSTVWATLKFSWFRPYRWCQHPLPGGPGSAEEAWPVKISFFLCIFSSFLIHKTQNPYTETSVSAALSLNNKRQYSCHIFATALSVNNGVTLLFINFRSYRTFEFYCRSNDSKYIDHQVL